MNPVPCYPAGPQFGLSLKRRKKDQPSDNRNPDKAQNTTDQLDIQANRKIAAEALVANKTVAAPETEPLKKTAEPAGTDEETDDLTLEKAAEELKNAFKLPKGKLAAWQMAAATSGFGSSLLTLDVSHQPILASFIGAVAAHSVMMASGRMIGRPDGEKPSLKFLFANQALTGAIGTSAMESTWLLDNHHAFPAVVVGTLVSHLSHLARNLGFSPVKMAKRLRKKSNLKAA